MGFKGYESSDAPLSPSCKFLCWGMKYGKPMVIDKTFLVHDRWCWQKHRQQERLAYIWNIYISVHLCTHTYSLKDNCHLLHKKRNLMESTHIKVDGLPPRRSSIWEVQQRPLMLVNQALRSGSNQIGVHKRKSLMLGSSPQNLRMPT